MRWLAIHAATRPPALGSHGVVAHRGTSRRRLVGQDTPRRSWSCHILFYFLRSRYISFNADLAAYFIFTCLIDQTEQPLGEALLQHHRYQ